MKKNLSLGVIFSGLLLSGCAQLANYTGGTPPTQTVPLQKTAYQASETLAQAGLQHPQTVWIPWYYTKTGDALYLQGTRLSIPGVGDNIPGFLDTPHGYLVVVRSSRRNLRLENDQVLRGPEYLFYDVSSTGKVEKLVGSIRDREDSSVVVDRHAIYIADPVGTVSGQRLFNYVGYSTSGQRVSGPQNVLFAAPEPTGGWSLMRVTKPHVYAPSCTTGNYAMNYISAREDHGNFHIVRKSNICEGATQIELFPRGNVVVDQPNYASSLTTGYFLRIWDNHPALTQHTNWYVGVMNPNASPKNMCWGLIGRECVSITYQYASKIGSSNTNVDLGDAGGIAVSSSIFKDADGHPAWSTQLNEGNGFIGGGLYYGYVSMLPGDNTTKHPVFPIMGSILNTLRKFITIGAGNDANYDLNGEYLSVNVVAPGHVIMIPAGQAEHSTQPRGYDIITGKHLSSAAVLDFLSRYGIQS